MAHPVGNDCRTPASELPIHECPRISSPSLRLGSGLRNLPPTDLNFQQAMELRTIRRQIQMPPTGKLKPKGAEISPFYIFLYIAPSGSGWGVRRLPQHRWSSAGRKFWRFCMTVRFALPRYLQVSANYILCVSCLPSGRIVSYPFLRRPSRTQNNRRPILLKYLSLPPNCSSPYTSVFLQPRIPMIIRYRP